LFLQVNAGAKKAVEASGNRGHLVMARAGCGCILGILCVAMTVRTVNRNTDWEQNLTLAIATARDNPTSAKACFWAGNVLAGHGSPDQFKGFGQMLLQRSIELFPGYGPSYFELAKAHRLDNNLAQAALYMAEAARHAAGKDDVMMGLDSIVPDLATANPEIYLFDLIECAAAYPDDPAPKFALALGYRAIGDLASAEEACESALALDRGFHEAARQLAMINLEQGKDDHAIHLMLMYTQHVRSNPVVRLVLASALLQKDPARHPDALAKAEFFINEAERLTRENPLPVTRELRTQLAQKRLTLLARDAGDSSQAPNPTLAANGGHP
jgi:tetratricopeptide (TPR) repeat protein